MGGCGLPLYIDLSEKPIIVTPERRNELLIIWGGLALIGVGAYYMEQPKTKEMSPQEQDCLARIAPGFQSLLMGHAAQQDANLLASIGRGQNADAALAASQYENAAGNIAIYSAYCQQYAACFPNKPSKATFDSCYSVFMDEKSDDKSD